MHSDRAIRRRLGTGDVVLQPFVGRNLNPASYDLTLDSRIRVPNPLVEEIDVAQVQPGYTIEDEIDPVKGYLLHPHAFLLASTVEEVHLDRATWARVEGKSSLGRIGLVVHATAGFIDPGFQGKITFEVTNWFPVPIRLRAGMRFGQIAFGPLTEGADQPYGLQGHYQHQDGPTESRFRMEPAGLERKDQCGFPSPSGAAWCWLDTDHLGRHDYL